MKKSLWTLIVVVLVILILLSIPWFMGKSAQRQLTRYVTETNQLNQQQGIEITLASYHRGWFSSDAKLLVRITDPALAHALRTWVFTPGLSPDQPVVFVERLHIAHGPIVSQSLHGVRHIHFALGAVTATLPWPAHVNKTLKTLYAGKPILVTRAILHYSGALDTYLTAPPLHYVAASKEGPFTVDWAGLESNIQLNSAYNKLKMNTTVHRFQASAMGQEFVIDKITKETLAHKTVGGFWLADHMSVSMPYMGAGSFFDLKNFNIVANTRLVKGSVSGNMQWKYDELKLLGQNYGPLLLQVEINNVRSAPLRSLYALSLQADKTNLPPQLFFKELLKLAPQFFQKNTAVMLKNFSLSTPQGKIAMRGALTWPQLPPSHNLAVVLDHMVGKFQGQIPASLLNALIDVSCDYDKKLVKPPAQDKQQEQTCYSMVQLMLRKLEAVGIIKKVGDAYAFNLSSKGPIVKAYGKQIFPPSPPAKKPAQSAQPVAG